MTEQLKPCLHCGSQNIEIHAIAKISPVKCMNCGMVAPNVGVWNSRPSPWVSVGSDEKPTTEEVLILIGGNHYDGIYEGDCFLYFKEGQLEAVPAGSHWMPLPPAPETKGE